MMGCDIHVYVEYKVGDGEWQAHPKHIVVAEYDDYPYIRPVSATGRNYMFFGIMCDGVRSHSHPDAIPARGLPKDCSDMIKKASDSWGIDGHSHSYMSIDEFEKVIDTYNNSLESIGDYRIQPTESTDMFYNWEDFRHDNTPPNYSTIVTGCRYHAEELQADYILMGEEPPEIQHRIVFWFDN